MADVRKAAILLTCLPEGQAAQILAKLTPKQIEAVAIEIAKLGHLSSEEMESVITEFADSDPSALGGESGGIDVATALIERAIGDQAGDTLENVKDAIEGLPFRFLKQIEPQKLYTCISDEHPQTIALILSHLPPAFGAEIVKGLPVERQVAVIRRIANIGQTSAEVIRDVERGLESRISTLTSQSKAGGVNRVAEILSVTDSTTGQTLMEILAQEAPALAEEIRRPLTSDL